MTTNLVLIWSKNEYRLVRVRYHTVYFNTYTTRQKIEINKQGFILFKNSIIIIMFLYNLSLHLVLYKPGEVDNYEVFLFLCIIKKELYI